MMKARNNFDDSLDDVNKINQMVIGVKQETPDTSRVREEGRVAEAERLS